MLQLNKEQKRAVASLNNSAGYRVLKQVVSSEVADTMEELSRANTRDAIYQTAIRLRTLSWVETWLERYPAEIQEGLKQEGDDIYG